MNRRPPLSEPSVAAPSALRCLVADVQPAVRKGVGVLLKHALGAVDVLEAGEGGQVKDALASSTVELVVSDVALPGFSGLDLVHWVAERSSSSVHLVYSAENEALYAERVLRAGASGYVSRFCHEGAFTRAVRSVLSGRTYASEAVRRLILERMVRGHSTGGVEQLSAREHEVFVLLGRGHTRGEIAERLGLSPKTVGTYLSRIAAKLGVDGIARVVEAAVRWISVGPGATGATLVPSAIGVEGRERRGQRFVEAGAWHVSKVKS